MKLEKREITLNEVDSMQDVLMLEKSLLNAYVNALEYSYRKENRNRLCVHLEETAKEIFAIKDEMINLQEKAI